MRIKTHHNEFHILPENSTEKELLKLMVAKYGGEDRVLSLCESAEKHKYPEKAFCVQTDDGEIIYVVKKMVEDYRKHSHKVITLTMPEWFAKKIGIA